MSACPSRHRYALCVVPFSALVYASRMFKQTLLLSLVLHSTAASAAIYRWVDADGRVHFSDRRVQGAEAVRVPRPPASAKATEQSGSPATGVKSADAPQLGPYTAFEIVSPVENEVLTQETAAVPVSLLINPPLQEGHRLDIKLDGVAAPVTNASTQFNLSGVTLGSHRIQAEIVGADGSLVSRTTLHNFHLRKPALPGVIR